MDSVPRAPGGGCTETPQCSVLAPGSFAIQGCNWRAASCYGAPPPRIDRALAVS
jgi:hypothetical protein